MGINSEQYKLLLRFLDAEMDETEMDAFDKELASNPELRAQLNFEQSLRDNFSAQNIKKIPIEESSNGNGKEMKSLGTAPIRKWFAIKAASVIAALILMLLIWKKGKIEPTVAKSPDSPSILKNDTVTVAQVGNDTAKNVDLAKLYDRYYTKDQIPEDYPLYLAEALTDYDKGKYNTLKSINLTDIPSTRGTSSSGDEETVLKWGYYYKGLAFLQTGNCQEAISNLDWVIKLQTGKPLKAKAQWYMALAYLRLNDQPKVVELCQRVINNNENKSLVKKAKEILDSLKK